MQLRAPPSGRNYFAFVFLVCVGAESRPSFDLDQTISTNRPNQFTASKSTICLLSGTSLFSERCLHSSERSPRVVVTVAPRQWPLRFVVRAPLQFSKRPSIATS